MATTVPVNAVETHLTYFLGTDVIYEMTDLDGGDLDGTALSFMVKRRKTDDDADALLTYTTSGGSPRVTTNNALVFVSVSSDDTDEFKPKIYHWELKNTDTGAENVLGFGTFTMQRGVHHA